MSNKLMNPRRVNLSGMVSSSGQRLDNDAVLFNASQLVDILDNDLEKLHFRRKQVSYVAEKCKMDLDIVPQLRTEVADRVVQALCACATCKELDPSVVDKRPSLRAWIDSQFEDYGGHLQADHYFEMSNRAVHESLVEGEKTVAQLRARLHAFMEEVRFPFSPETIDIYKENEKYYMYWLNRIDSATWLRPCRFSPDIINKWQEKNPKKWLTVKRVRESFSTDYHDHRNKYEAYIDVIQQARQKKINDYHYLIHDGLSTVEDIRRNAVVGTRLLLEELTYMIQRRCNAKEAIISAIGNY